MAGKLARLTAGKPWPEIGTQRFVFWIGKDIANERKVKRPIIAEDEGSSSHGRSIRGQYGFRDGGGPRVVQGW
jgi:hypothetical protein